MTARRSSFCNFGNCVEVEFLASGDVAVSDTPERYVVLTFTPDEWREFIAGVKNGEFDLDLPRVGGDE